MYAEFGGSEAETKKLEIKIKDYMEKHHMVNTGCHIIAGISGGADSMCMLLVLLALQKVFEYTISVVHVEHGIRGADSMRDAAFVRNFCENRGIECSICHYKVPEYAKEYGMGEEEAGRILRYASFEAEQRKYQGVQVKIAVAHNSNDNAETMLFHLARGSGVRGLCGIAPVRGNIIRPLLAVSRPEIEAYLAEMGQDFCSDATNLSARYSRNRIRMEALPALNKVNCCSIGHMLQMSEDMREMESYLEKQAEKELKVCSTYLENGSGYYLKKEPFEQAQPVLQKEMLYQIVSTLAGSCKDIAGVHIRQMLGLFDKQNGRKVQLPYGIEAERVYGGIEIKTEKKVEIKKDGADVPIGQFSFRLIEKKLQTEPQISEKKYTKWFDYDKINSDLVIRNPREEDFFVLDENGGTKKLNRYYIDRKIPRRERIGQLVLADGSHILWAVPDRISAEYKVTENTKQVLVVNRERIPQ